MLQRASARMLPLFNRAADVVPVAPACCNACRTCVTTNIFGIAAGGAIALATGMRGLVKRFARAT